MNSEPQPREDLMATIDQRIREALRPLAGEINRRTCLTCVHFKEPEIFCNLHKANPPARIVAFSCDDYMDNLGVPY